MPLRPRPRPYKLPTTEAEPQPAGDNAAWLDALGGVVKRVPVTDEDSNVVDHVLVPVVGGKIEGGAPDKVFYFRCPDDALRGYRIFAGDLLLCVPAQKVEDGAISLFLLSAGAWRARPTSWTATASICRATTASSLRKRSPPPRRGCWPGV